MINEGVAVMLPISVDLLVSGNFSGINRIAGMPGTHVRFHPWVNIPQIVARAITASPISIISHGEVEIGSS